MKMHVISIWVNSYFMEFWLLHGYFAISTPEFLSSSDWIIICGQVRNFFGDDIDLCSKIIALDQRG
jgi:hypothetical protein